MIAQKEFFYLSDDFESNYLEDLKSEHHPTTFIDGMRFKILYIAILDHSDSKIVLKSLPFLFVEEKIYRYHRDKSSFEELSDGLNSLASVIFDILEHNQNIYLEYSTESDRLEDLLYERKVPRYFMDIWFDLKKDMTKIDRYYHRTGLVLKEVVRRFEGHKNFPQIVFNDMSEDITTMSGNSQYQLSKLDNLHNYYNSIKNDKLNSNIYLLTVLSGIFLPLNLIVGFFGMNTENLFFKESPNGTMLVVYLLIGVIVFMMLGLKFFKIIDNYVLRFFLGRYPFYDRLTKRIENIGDAFKLNL